MKKILGTAASAYLMLCACTCANSADANLAEKGKAVFMANCIVCHGEKGDGKGPAAAAIVGKKPRDFTRGQFQYGSSDQELFATITKGVPGTAMPSWSALSEDDRKAVVQFIRTLKK